MAVKDIIPIKYWIPKLDFTVRLGTSQYFKVMYKIYTDGWNNDIGWTVLREQCLVQPDGTTSESDKLVLTNWQVCQMEVQSVEYLKYNAGESIVLNGKTSYINEEPTALGESFPESGLRYFITP